MLQPRFENTRGKRPQRLAGHPRFRAGYDFLLLRAESGEADPALAKWWTEFQERTGLGQQNRAAKPKPRRRPGPQRKRSGRKRPPRRKPPPKKS